MPVALAGIASAEPRNYECRFSTRPPVIDGDIAEKAWNDIPWTADFLDIRGADFPAPRFRTRAKLLWTAEGLYVAVELVEPHVWVTLTEKNSIIFHDNDLEIFIDPDGEHPEDNRVLSPQGVLNMHVPEQWGRLVFVKPPGPGKAE